MRTLLITMLTVAVSASTACGDSPSAPTTSLPVTAVTVAGGSTAGQTFQLTATARFTDGTTQDVTSKAGWDSSNPALATVSAGTVTVLASGEVEVRATYQGTTGSLRVLVAMVPVTAVDIGGGGSGTQFQLTATARLADGSTQDVTRVGTWSTSNAQIATVSPTGLVNVVGNGEVDISATYRGTVGMRHFVVATERTFRLSGIVREPGLTGRPVAYAAVRALGDAGPTYTNADGAFAFASLPAGRRLIEASKEGYRIWESDLILDSDKSIVIELTPEVPTTIGVTRLRPTQ